MSRIWGGRVRFRYYLWVPLILILSMEMFPLYWMTTMALKNPADADAYPPILMPSAPTLDNFKTIFKTMPFGRYTFNSLIVALGTTIISMLFGVSAAYGIVRTGNQKRLGMAILFSRIVPLLICLIPWFKFLASLRLANTYTALIATHLVTSLPLVIWIMIGFFEDLDKEFEEAALADGCSRFGCFWRIAVPLASQGIIVSSLLTFIMSWNDFIRAVIFAGPMTRTLPAAIFNVMTFENMEWGPLAAAGFLVTFPMILVTLALQRYIVAGLTTGGLKG